MAKFMERPTGSVCYFTLLIYMRQAFAVVGFVNRITHKRAAPGQSIPPLALEDKLADSTSLLRKTFLPPGS